MNFSWEAQFFPEVAGKIIEKQFASVMSENSKDSATRSVEVCVAGVSMQHEEKNSTSEMNIFLSKSKTESQRESSPDTSDNILRNLSL